MCSGIALASHLLPLDLIERHQLQGRFFDCGGEREVQFLFRHRPALLPVWHEGGCRRCAGSNRRGESKTLPPTGWTWKATVEAGAWKKWGGEMVDIPASKRHRSGSQLLATLTRSSERDVGRDEAASIRHRRCRRVTRSM